MTTLEIKYLNSIRRLKQWLRKVRLAQTKIKSLNKTVKYYQRKVDPTGSLLEQKRLEASVKKTEKEIKKLMENIGYE